MAAKIDFLNKGEFIAACKARSERVKAAVPLAANQMGVIALNNIHPLTPKKTMNLDGSYFAEVTDKGFAKAELWVGSQGAFSENGYNYVPIQEFVYHPHLRPGWHQAIPEMIETWKNLVESAARIQ